MLEVLFEVKVPPEILSKPDNLILLAEKSRTALFPSAAPCSNARVPAVELSLPSASETEDLSDKSAPPVFICEEVLPNVTDPVTVRSLSAEPRLSALFCKLILPSVKAELRVSVESAKRMRVVLSLVVMPLRFRLVPSCI